MVRLVSFDSTGFSRHVHRQLAFESHGIFRGRAASQSVVLFEADTDNRSFVFSTPRLKSNGGLFLNVPFSHRGFDELFKMRFEARPYERIKDMLQVDDEDDELFSSFFTTKEPALNEKRKGDGIRINYFGHACVLIETKDVSILSDPVTIFLASLNDFLSSVLDDF